ncbi:hypothetical protein Focb16_v000050 [Fusarium oxysporum f. sp. cubense]|uniref:Uncharacterized protein n=1 Tax=Fusarium oxysporum f. sp. cubense TaxID=61366 RepID=A0A559L6W7_FUSOC|nr:hypothetical protein Focb16_v000050 [Fusarium oxysporum f. sp. cubense]
MHKRQCLEYLIAHHGDLATVHAEKYFSYCCRLKDEDLISEAGILLLRAKVEPTRASGEARMAVLARVTADLETSVARYKGAGRHIPYVEKVLLLAEVLEELRDISGEEREYAWPAITDILNDVEATCSSLRSKPDGLLLLMLEVSYPKTMFVSMTTSSDETEAFSQSSAENTERSFLQPFHRSLSRTGIDTRQVFEPTKFLYDLYLAVQSGSVLSFRSVMKSMNSEAQRLREEGHPLEEARYLLCQGILCYVLASGSCIDEEQLGAIGAGFETKVDGLFESLKCFEGLESLIAVQAFNTGSLQTLLYDTALNICYELDDNDLTFAWVQKSKAYTYSTWLQNCTGGDDDSSTRQVETSPKADVSFQDMLWVSSASPRRLIFVDWITVHLDPEPRLLLLVLQFSRDDDGISRRLSLVDLDISVDYVEEKARHLSTASLDTVDWRRTLSGFTPLIQPLEELCEEGDVLILSPTGCTHNLPLHALDLNGEPLIDRNPVACVPSISCLKQLEAPSAGADRQREWRAAVFGVYDTRIGELRPQHNHSNSAFTRDNVLEHNPDDYTLVNVRTKTVQYGQHYGRPAALIIFRFIVKLRPGNKRLRSFNTKIEFQKYSDPGVDSTNRTDRVGIPTVAALAPEERRGKIYTEEQSTTISTSIDVPLGPSGPTSHVGGERASTLGKEHVMQLSGWKMSFERGVDNVAVWDCVEAKKAAKGGIPGYRGAIVVEYQEAAKFQSVVTLDGRRGIWNAASGLFEWLNVFGKRI